MWNDLGMGAITYFMVGRMPRNVEVVKACGDDELGLKNTSGWNWKCGKGMCEKRGS